MRQATERFFGKYRGTVVNNVDPLQIGRVQVTVPDIAAQSPWAMPCVPWAGPQTGMFAIPPIGSGVWVEFEQGNLDQPIWVGGYWASAAEVPALAHVGPPPIPGLTLQTPSTNGLLITDLPGPLGGIALKSSTGATIVVNDSGIYIQNGKGASIVLVGPAVTINDGAMVIT